MPRFDVDNDDNNIDDIITIIWALSMPRFDVDYQARAADPRGQLLAVSPHQDLLRGDHDQVLKS